MSEMSFIFDPFCVLFSGISAIAICLEKQLLKTVSACKLLLKMANRGINNSILPIIFPLIYCFWDFDKSIESYPLNL